MVIPSGPRISYPATSLIDMMANPFLQNAAVLAYPEYIPQAQALAVQLGLPHHRVSVHKFPDGESRVALPSLAAENIILCRSLNQPNDKLVELMLTCATARGMGVQRILLVAPYLCYMRQDIAFHPGEAISQQIIGRFLSEQVDGVITVDPHLHRIQHLQEAIPGPASVAINSAPALAGFLQSLQQNALLVGPDEESEQWVATIAEQTGLDFIVASKERHGDRDVRIALPEHDYHQRDIILVDDIASTGRTLAECASLLKQNGAASIQVLVTHALFCEDAYEYLQQAGVDRIWSTDSIHHITNRIALAPLLANSIRQLEI